MKKLITFIFSIMLAVSTIAATWNGTIATAFAGGTGTSTDPYLIGSGEQLAYLAQQTNTVTSYSVGLYFKLTADVDLGGSIQWTPIGINTTNFKFAGVFDGNNHLISNLYYNATVTTTNSYVGLFGYIAGATAGSAVVKNTTITGSIMAANFVGGFAGRADNVTFWNCTNGASVKGNTGVSGATYVGGIVGRLGSGSAISYCSNQGTIIGVADHAGGIVGNAASGTIASPCLIQFCSNLGNVTGNTLYVGGITGTSGGQITVDQCFNTASVLSVQGASGGIVGYGGDGTASPNTLKTIISNCYNTGSVSTTVPKTPTSGPPYTSGGILGFSASKWYYTISNCYSTGLVTNTAGAQAILGYHYTTGAPTGWAIAPANCYYDNTIANTATTGGTGMTTTELQAAASTLNNNQSPAVWVADATSINAGLPVLAWQSLPIPPLTALKNVEFQKNYKVYSLNKRIRVDINDNLQVSVSIYDVSGSLVMKQKSVNNSFNASIQNPGVYIVNIAAGSNSYSTKTVIF